MAKRKVAFWRKEGPQGPAERLSSKSKAKAKRRAKAAGRPYPNAVDNIAVARADK